MKAFTTFLEGFFQGKQSMTRLVLLIASILFWTPYAYIGFVEKKLPPIDSYAVAAYALVVGGKAAQNYFDRKAGIPVTPESKTS
jgi:hypothetical protein